MAAKKTNQATKLVVKVVTGTKAGGGSLTASRTFGNINPALSDEDVLSIGQKLGALQSRDVDSVSRSDTAEITDEE